ncbi:MAG: SRPBCC family protein [Solirubrobacterales bacterium]
MTTYREQAVIDAPAEEIWGLVGDPNRHPEWWPLVVRVEGLPDVVPDATYKQVSRVVGGKLLESTFQIAKLDELHEIKVVCTDYGTNARWLITPAQESTVVDIEMGFESDRASLGVLRVPLARRYLRTWVDLALGGLRGAVADEPEPARSPADA